MICKSCGKIITDRIYPDCQCQACYKYFLKGGKIHSLPPLGVVEYDDEGKVICHICGRSYKRLGSHIKESHNMTIKEYKELYGLCNCARTTEQSYHNTMHKHAIENHMDKKIIEIGEATRIKKGETSKRKNKPVRLQEIIEKRQRKVLTNI